MRWPASASKSRLRPAFQCGWNPVRLQDAHRELAAGMLAGGAAVCWGAGIRERMSLPGDLVQRLEAALLDAFPDDDALDQLIRRVEMQARVPARAALATRVGKLVEVVDAQGRVRDLLDAALDLARGNVVLGQARPTILERLEEALARPSRVAARAQVHVTSASQGHEGTSLAPAEQLREVRDLVARVFSPADLEMLVHDHLGVPLANLVGPGTHPQKVFELLQACEARGCLERLLDGVAQERKHNAEVALLMQRIGRPIALSSSRAGVAVAAPAVTARTVGAVGARHGGTVVPWYLAAPVDFARPEAEQANRMLATAYVDRRAATALAEAAGVNLIHINREQPPFDLMRDIMKQAAAERRLESLLMTALADSRIAAYHAQLLALTAPGSVAVAAAAGARTVGAVGTELPDAAEHSLSRRRGEELQAPVKQLDDAYARQKQLEETGEHTAKLLNNPMPSASRFLSACAKKLAASVGPMAKALVSEAVRKVCGERPFSRADAPALIAHLADGIEDSDDRALFLRTARALLRDTAPFKLVVLSSNFAREEFELSRSRMTVGRANNNDIVIKHSSIRRNHAILMLDLETGRYTISILQSSSGMRVNGVDHDKVELRRGDVIDLGYVRFLFIEAGEDLVFERDAMITDVPEASRRRGILVSLLAAAVVFAVVMAVYWPRTTGSDEHTLSPGPAGSGASVPDAKKAVADRGAEATPSPVAARSAVPEDPPARRIATKAPSTATTAPVIITTGQNVILPGATKPPPCVAATIDSVISVATSNGRSAIQSKTGATTVNGRNELQQIVESIDLPANAELASPSFRVDCADEKTDRACGHCYADGPNAIEHETACSVTRRSDNGITATCLRKCDPGTRAKVIHTVYYTMPAWNEHRVTATLPDDHNVYRLRAFVIDLDPLAGENFLLSGTTHNGRHFQVSSGMQNPSVEKGLTITTTRAGTHFQVLVFADANVGCKTH
jgi:hypothetical protein